MRPRPTDDRHEDATRCPPPTWTTRRTSRARQNPPDDLEGGAGLEGRRACSSGRTPTGKLLTPGSGGARPPALRTQLLHHRTAYYRPRRRPGGAAERVRPAVHAGVRRLHDRHARQRSRTRSGRPPRPRSCTSAGTSGAWRTCGPSPAGRRPSSRWTAGEDAGRVPAGRVVVAAHHHRLGHLAVRLPAEGEGAAVRRAVRVGGGQEPSATSARPCATFTPACSRPCSAC